MCRSAETAFVVTEKVYITVISSYGEIKSTRHGETTPKLWYDE